MVATSTIQQVITEGRRLQYLNRHADAGRCGLILPGPARTGKTTCLAQLGKTIETMHHRRHPHAAGHIPVVYITAPPAATPRMIAVEFARFLGLPLTRRSNVTDVLEAVCGVCLDAATTLVCVDEIHNISLGTRHGAEATGHPASRVLTRAPSRRSPHTSGSAPPTTATCAGPACTARSPPSDTPAATPRSPASCAATPSPPPAEPAGNGSPPRPRSHGSTIPGPLPFRTAPVAGETIASCQSRTAAASHLPAGVITAYLPSWFAARAAACDDLAATGQPQPAGIRHLAALTGTSETALLHALPALGIRTGSRPPVRAALACRRCASRTGQRAPVPVHLPAHQRACTRHRTWLGRAIQIGLTAAPDIIRACQHASRLARQHGITRLLLAETTARQRAAGTAGSPHARRCAAALTSSNPGLDPGHPDTTEAAAYPETIKMAAAILAGPGALPAGPE